MKRSLHKVAIVLAGFIFIVGYIWLINPAQAAKWTLPFMSSTLQGIEPKPILVEDFEDGNFLNALEGAGECWGSPNSSIFCDIQFLGNKGFLRMQYDVTQLDAFALYSSPLRNLNMKALSTVWVAIKGEQGQEPIYIEFKDCGSSGSSQFPKELISDHLAHDIDSSEWSGVAIPLTEFSAITDWSCIDLVNILAHKQINSGQSTIYVDDIRLLADEVLLDDFHDTIPENELGGVSGFWEANSDSSITFSFSNGELKLDYSVINSDPVAEAVYFIELRNTNLLLDKDTLFFMVRGNEGSEEIAIEFRDCGLNGETHIPKIKVSDYLDGGITTDWRPVAMPLATFADGMNWRCVETMNILVSANPWLESGEGTVFIDNIKFAPSGPTPLLVDRFDDCNNWNTLLSEWTDHVNNQDNSIEIDPDESHRLGGSGCGYRVNYNVIGNTGAWFRSGLEGIDATEYSHLQFWVRGTEGDEEMHVYLTDLNGKQRYFEDITITTDWQKITIPLSYFSPVVDLTNLSELKIAFEWKTMAGELYFDNFGFLNPQQIFVPIVLKDYQESCSDYVPNCPVGHTQYEPNNFRCSTTASLDSGTPIDSYICSADDIDDYYYIDVTQPGPINVNLTSIPSGVDYDLYLYYQESIVAKSNNFGNASEALSYSPSRTGRYYIRIYPYSGHSLSPYTLRANFR